MRKDETIIECELGTVEVRNDHGPLREQGQGKLFLEVNNDVTKETAFIGVDADRLRDAIDKAVGPRDPHSFDDPESIRQRVEAWDTIIEHPFLQPVFDDLPLEKSVLEAVLKKLDKAQYSYDRLIKHRDRHLRHIEDIEATLTRRNRRHEQDQERIRELEAELAKADAQILELSEEAERYSKALEEKAAAPSLEEQLEALDAVPAGYAMEFDHPRTVDAPSAHDWAVPPVSITRIEKDSERAGQFRLFEPGDGYGWCAPTKAVLELGLTAEDFGPSAEMRRKEYEDKGLADWEIELLMGA